MGGSVIFISICLIALGLMRRGYFKAAAWIFMVVILLGNNTRLMRAPMQDADEALLTFFVPITIAGVLLGRRILLLMLGISSLIALGNAEKLGTITIVVFFLNAAIVSFLIDLLGHTLRNELKIALIGNQELEQAHQALEASSAEIFKLNERLTITLKSIGDGVITTDAQVRVSLLNAVAEHLTGWTQAEAEGQPLSQVFHIINEETRQVVENPAEKVMREGITVGLANHTLLLAKDGREIPIDDSGAPITDSRGMIAGVVLVFRDISERRRAEMRETELIASKERQRLARELHDSVSQTLFTTSVIAGSLPSLFESNTERGLHQLAELHDLTRGAMAEMRTLLLELRPENVVKTSFGTLIHQLGNVAQARQKIAVSILTRGDDRQSLPEAVHLALYRIAQESLNNTINHGDAKQVRIRLNRSPDSLELVIVDDGQGFDVSQAYSGFGLTSMRERAASIRAVLKIQSKVGLGTRVKAIWKA
ncbi:MAG: PAS domain S-box protein [Anaerolineae bacterium]|nr:PAS domain S-box protein [Anaerolineae bacterium]